MALLISLSRPTSLISSIQQTSKALSRSYNSLSRSTRWPLGLLDDTRQRLDKEKEEKVRKVEEERDDLSRELRYTQQVVAGELAGWQEWRAKVARKAIKDLARATVIQERSRLEGMRRAIRKLRVEGPASSTASPGADILGNSGAEIQDSASSAVTEPANVQLDEEADTALEVERVDDGIPTVVKTEVKMPARVEIPLELPREDESLAAAPSALENVYDSEELD